MQGTPLGSNEGDVIRNYILGRDTHIKITNGTDPGFPTRPESRPPKQIFTSFIPAEIIVLPYLPAMFSKDEREFLLQKRGFKKFLCILYKQFPDQIWKNDIF